MLKRTSFGLANEYLFFKVDYVVYCEGEPHPGGSLSFDETFWKQVFSRAGRSFEIKSAGSKQNVQLISRDVIENNIATVLTAMDSDYEHFNNKEVSHRSVLYTCGYSWESDIVEKINFGATLALFANVKDVPSAEQAFQQFLSDNLKSMWRCFLVDLRYISSPERLFNRQKPMSIIDVVTTSYPKLRVDQIVASFGKLRGSGSNPCCLPINGPVSSYRHFHGKVVSRFIYSWFVCFVRQFRSKRTVSYDSFVGFLISNFNHELINRAIKSHYEKFFAAI